MLVASPTDSPRPAQNRDKTSPVLGNREEEAFRGLALGRLESQTSAGAPARSPWKGERTWKHRAEMLLRVGDWSQLKTSHRMSRRPCLGNSHSGAPPNHSMSSQGDTVLRGAPRSTRSNTSIPTIFCIQVVPHLDGVDITTSSGRNLKRSHRALSAMNPPIPAKLGLSDISHARLHNRMRLARSTEPSAS